VIEVDETFVVRSFKAQTAGVLLSLGRSLPRFELSLVNPAKPSIAAAGTDVVRTQKSEI
jgi:hypothetical protein